MSLWPCSTVTEGPAKQPGGWNASHATWVACMCTGARGGRAEFSWDNVKSDKDREFYLGHSVKATTGRWQKGTLLDSWGWRRHVLYSVNG